MRIELYINGQLTDLSENVRITVDKVVSEYKDPLKKTGTYSLPIILPYTHTNKAIFFQEDDKQVLGKFKRRYPALLVVDDNLIIDGEFLHTKNSAKGFEGAIGSSRIRNPKIGDLLGNKSLRDISSFQRLDFDGNPSVVEFMNRELEFRPEGNPSTKRSEVCFAHVYDSFRSLTHRKGLSYEDLGLSHFCGTILEKIFQDAGYTTIGNVLNNATYRKLIMLYSDRENSQPWNYGKLNPMTANCEPTFFSAGDSFEYGVTNTYTRQSDTVYVIGYPFAVQSGDLSSSLGSDGVYTCKYTGIYQLRVSASHAITTYSGATVTSKAFTCLRAIEANEFIPENLLPVDFDTADVQYLDEGTLHVGNSNTVTVRMEQGRQYVIQRYVSVPNTFNPRNYFLYNPTGGAFSITSCDGPLLVNPALFLPRMEQTEFVNAIFKIFNLYYQINDDLKSITLFTRDEFFSRSLGQVIDLTNQLSVEGMEESPLTSKEVAQTYYSYKEDSSDYLLNRTDYLARVNGEQEEGRYELPFAPLAFIQVKYELYDVSTGATPDYEGYDLLPAILPDEESEDRSVLTSEANFTTPGSWEPRICLYHGNKSFKAAVYSYSGGFIRSNPLTIILRDGTEITPPKLGFFDYEHQPAYKVVENNTLRSFTLELGDEPTIYQTNDQDFLRTTATVNALNVTSLATNLDGAINPKGLFFNLYANDLLIANLSNYLEGIGRMNPVLFNSLNGRQILRIDSDLFLLESIKAYELGGDRARYRIYKLIAGAVDNQIGNGSDDGTPSTFTATATYTASCGTGFIGTDVTETFTADSNISQANADALALAGAQQAAEDGLFCLRSYTSTQSHTAICPADYVGSPVTKTVTFVSTVSQDDADLYAAVLAQIEAEAELVCTYEAGGDENPGG